MTSPGIYRKMSRRHLLPGGRLDILKYEGWEAKIGCEQC